MIDYSTRVRAAVLGSFLGDSLALGLHWIYDTGEVARLAAPHLEGGVLSRLLPPPLGSYHPTKKAGEFTHYGDQALTLLRAVTAGGGFSLREFHARWLALFSGYEGYVDGATRNSLARFEAGVEPEDGGAASSDLAGAARLAPLLLHHGQDLPALVAAARAQTRMTHNHAQVLDAAEFLARSAHALLQGAAMREAFASALAGNYATDAVREWVAEGLDSAGVPTMDVIASFGQSCNVAGAFPAVIHLAARHEGDLARGLTECVLAGGDSAARAMAAGLLLGARLGPDALPAAWLRDLAATTEIEAALGR